MSHKNTLVARHAARERLRNDIIGKIRSGELTPGSPLASEKELTQMDGISLRGVQTVLREMSEEGWIVRKHRKGTFVADRDALPSLASVDSVRAPSCRAAMLQGVLWGQPAKRDLPAPFRRGIVNQVELHLVRRGIEVMYSPTVFDQIESFLRANAKTIDVLIVPVLAELYNVVEKFDIPCVGIINMPHNGLHVPFDGVATNNEKAAYEATRHLIDLGHTRIAHLGYVPDSSTKERYDGYRRAMDESGLELDDSFVEVPNYTQDHHAAWNMRAGYDRMLHILAKCPDVTALFAANDPLALGAIRAVQECGRSVPKDFSVIGFDDRKEAEHSVPPLTTAHIDMGHVAQLTADLVVDRLENPGKPGRIERIDAPLVMRGSASRPASLNETM